MKLRTDNSKNTSFFVDAHHSVSWLNMAVTLSVAGLSNNNSSKKLRRLWQRSGRAVKRAG
jgi:hypothetical protein